ncbi:MAG: aminopeptidase P family protein [Gammaproteobacteria bacterium]|nr:MAG: aminopeptidase P family protein [Gammaproteobacteria bacterium]
MYGTHGQMQVDYEQRMDFNRMRSYREARIQKYMDQFDVDFLVLCETGNKRYSTSTAVASPEVDNMGRYAMIPRGGKPYIFGFGSEVAAEKLRCPWIADRAYPAHTPMQGALPMEWGCYNKFLEDLDMVLKQNGLSKKNKIGIDVMDVQLILALQGAGYTIADGQAVMQHARAIKNDDEIMCLKIGAAIVDAAHHEVAKTIEPGAKENDLQAVASYIMHKHGAQWVHNVQVTSGNRTNPHPHLSSDRIIQPGDLIFLDIVLLYNGYHTCYYRCFCCGEPTKKQVEVHKRTYDMQVAGLELVKPGNTTADIANAWPDASYWGFKSESKAFGLAFGHGIGVGLWEFPIISKLYSLEHPVEIEPGMVFALETYAGEGYDGVRIEDEVVVTEDDKEIITKFPADKLIGCGMSY